MYGFALIFVVLACFTIFIIFLYRRKQNEKEQYKLEIKSRNNNLDHQLKNPLIDEKKGSYHPYQEKFAVGTENKRHEQSFQLIEKTNQVVREYVFQQYEPVYIGKKEGILTVFRTEFEGESFCRIYSKQDLYCIKAIGEVEVKIKRGRSETVVGSKGIILNNKDLICLPGADYMFQIIQL